MKTDSTDRKIMLVLLIAGILLSAFFGLRAVHSFAHLRQDGFHPGNPDVNTIRGWMTVPYIARVYRVSPDYLYQQIGVPATGNDGKRCGFSTFQSNHPLSPTAGNHQSIHFAGLNGAQGFLRSFQPSKELFLLIRRRG